MVNLNELIRATHYGLHIYAQILSYYYPDSIVFKLQGKECKNVKNPFNEDKPTLNINQFDNMFYYQDTELEEFKGNALDFASLYYHLSGEELLYELNRELNLHIDTENAFYINFNGRGLKLLIEMVLPHFSFYYSLISNTEPYATISLLDVYKKVKSQSYKPRTLRLRGISELEAASKFKRKSFNYVTFSGEFSKRSDAALICHSGLLTLDFDHVDNIPLLKKILLGDTGFKTELMFISPSGNGLKWIISIDINLLSHQLWFEAVAVCLKQKHGLEVDNSGKDISRACFLPYDPDVYINPDYILDSPD